MTYASMCPRCGHRASSRGAVIVRGVPVFGSRRGGVFGRAARRVAGMLLVGAAVGGALMLSHLYRAPNTHEADDEEERCRSIQESGENEPGQLSDCLTRLSRLRAAERAREASPTRTLDSARRSP